MTRLSPEDRNLVEAQIIDPAACPNFEVIKYCLIWSDEEIETISEEGRQFIADLIIARGYIHRGVPTGEWGFGNGHYEQVWYFANEIKLKWIGFSRLDLNDADRRYLSDAIQQESEHDEL